MFSELKTINMKIKLFLICIFTLSFIYVNAQEKQNSGNRTIGFNESADFSHSLKCNKSYLTKATGDQHWDHQFDSTNSPNGPVYAIATVDSFVYIGGNFDKVGSLNVNNIARWDGHSWVALGSGIESTGPLSVKSIVINGTDLYVGGIFTNAGGITASNIAKWDGITWSALGTGTNNIVTSIVVDQNGDIYAGGCFTQAGGNNANHIAKWTSSSSSWSSLGDGFSGVTNPVVYSLLINGTNLIAGGDFKVAGTDTAKNIALWNGTGWASVGGGTDSLVYSLALKGTDIYAAGKFLSAGGTAVNHYAKWNGSAWSDVDGGVDYAPESIIANLTDVYVASSINTLGFNNITKYDCCWDPFGSGLNDKAHVIALKGKDVWVGGNFTQAGGKPSYYFAHWNAYVNFDGVNEINPSEKEITVYPNPVSNEMNILFNLEKNQNINFNLYDIIGRKVFSKTQNSHQGLNTIKLELKEMVSGEYILELSGNDYRSYKKIIIN